MSEGPPWCCPMHDGPWLARQIGGLIPRTADFDRELVGRQIAESLLRYDDDAHAMHGDASSVHTKRIVREVTTGELLRQVADQCESHLGGWDSRMDEAIAHALGWDKAEDGWHEVFVFAVDGSVMRSAHAVALPAFTQSLDAAMSLIRPLLNPKWRWQWDVISPGPNGSTFRCEIAGPGHKQHGYSSCRVALAVCAAALRARAAFALA